MENLSISVRLFGAFRDLAPDADSFLKLEMPESSTVKELREAIGMVLRQRYPHSSLVELAGKSAVGSESEILRDDAKLDAAQGPFALLPPVCGGAR